MGGIIIDLIIIALIALSTYFGYKKGLVRVIFKICSFIIAIILMLILYKPVSNYVINNTTYDEKIKTAISEKLSTTDLELGKIENNEESPYPEIVVEYVNKYVTEAINEGKANVTEYVAENLSVIVINVIVAIALFISINILLLIVQLLTRFLVKLPVLKQFDKTGGIIYGVLRGIIYIYLILAILSIFSALITNFGIQEMIQKSHLGSAMYNNNIILKLVLK